MVCRHGDISTRVSPSRSSHSHSRHYTIPILLYPGVFPDISPTPDFRAYHFSEVWLVFGVFPSNSTNSIVPPPTADELALSKYMQSTWVAFARDPAKGLLDYGWPLYNASTKSNATTLMELGGFYNRSGSHLAQGRLLDFLCSSQDTLITVQEQLSVLIGDAAKLLL
jgi:hypothetical protein